MSNEMSADDAPPLPELAVGPLRLTIAEGDPRRIRFGGIEVLRRLSYPVRDENWGTAPVETISEGLEEGHGTALYRRDFRAVDGAFEGAFTLRLLAGPDAARLQAAVTIRALRPFLTNRAGFTLLHPIIGVAGQPLDVTHPDGTVERTTFPDLISPAQPAFGIAGLAHRVGGVSVGIRMAGEVFEMEDQRNWSDASYKTYCRPLFLPRPYPLDPGAPMRQEIEIVLSGRPETGGAAGASPATGIGPAIALACEPGLSSGHALPLMGGLPVLLRLRSAADLSLFGGVTGPGTTLELVVPGSADPAAWCADMARHCKAAGLHPASVVALPEAYLASYQPDGPWPAGPIPADLVAPLRVAFPKAEVGGGSLTLFTEFNRCRPPGNVDFVTFGSSAIVHAADDLSVLETLEAMPDIFRSARALAPGKPLRLGLMSIAMRSNPYGAGLLPNPHGLRLAMTGNDPRQHGRFAAAWAVGLLAAAAEGGVASLALSMPDGPLGCQSPAGVSPLYHVIAAAAGLAGQQQTITRRGGYVELRGPGLVLAANLGPTPVDIAQGAARVRLLSQATMPAAAVPDWLDGADAPAAGLRLNPFDLLFAMDAAP